MKLTIKGRVFSGIGEGKHFTQLEWARKQFIKKLGFDPYPGTLNIKLESEDDLKMADILRNKQGIEIERMPKEGFCTGKCFKALLAKKIRGAIVIPEISRHSKDVVELIAPVMIRTTLGLKDGDKVKVEVWTK